MKKIIKRILLVLLLVLVALVLVVKFKLNDIVKTLVESQAPELLGVPVTLAGADLRPLMGQASLNGLVVGNPEGYQTPSLFELGSIKVKLDMGSLKTDTIRIEEILIREPSITYEKSLKKSNLAQLLENLEREGDGNAPEAEPETAGADEGGGKKVVIDVVRVEGAHVRLSTALLMGKAIDLPLPSVEIKDIGKEKQDGTSIPEALVLVLKEVLKGVTGVVSSAGGLAVDAAGAVGGAAVDAAGAVGGTAVDAVGAVGGTAVDGVKSVGSGAAKLTKGLGGLLGGGKDEEKKEAP